MRQRDFAKLRAALDDLTPAQWAEIRAAITTPPQEGESKTARFEWGTVEWKTIKKVALRKDDAGNLQPVTVEYGPYAYLRIIGEAGKHHSFYLGGAPAPIKADLEERLARWRERGQVGERRSYRAGEFPAGERHTSGSRRRRPPTSNE